MSVLPISLEISGFSAVLPLPPNSALIAGMPVLMVISRASGASWLPGWIAWPPGWIVCPPGWIAWLPCCVSAAGSPGCWSFGCSSIRLSGRSAAALSTGFTTTVSALGIMLNGLCIENGSTRRSATTAQIRQRTHLGERLITARSSTAARTIQPAAMLILSSFKNTSVISSPLLFSSWRLRSWPGCLRPQLRTVSGPK